MHQAPPKPGDAANRWPSLPRAAGQLSDRTAVTVPPVTGVLIRAQKVSDSLPELYSTIELAGTAIVVFCFTALAELAHRLRSCPGSPVAPDPCAPVA
jgi:hypothetical protein